MIKWIQKGIDHRRTVERKGREDMKKINDRRIVEVLHTVRKGLFHLVGGFEVAVTALFVIGIAIRLFDVALQIGTSASADGFQNYLKLVYEVLIGIELVKLICRNDLHTLVEVLLFAVSRHIILGHLSMIETLIGVAAIVGLFSARKFLFVHPETRAEMERRREYMD